jgi:hypothetical protein
MLQLAWNPRPCRPTPEMILKCRPEFFAPFQRNKSDSVHSSVPTYREKVIELAKFKNFRSLQNLVTRMVPMTMFRNPAFPVTDVVLLAHDTGTRPVTKSFTNIPDLQNVLYPDDLNKLSSNTSAAPSLRLFFLQGLSDDLMDLFGSRFQIDPLFFQAHVELSRFGRRLEEPRLLASGLYRQWFQLQSPQIRQKPRHSLNVDDIYECHIMMMSEKVWGHIITESRTTVWIGQDQSSPGTTIGVVLLDPAITVGGQVLQDPDSCVPTPDLKTAFSHSLPGPTGSAFENIVELASRYPWFAPIHSTDAIDYLTIVCPPTYAVCAEWLAVVQRVEDFLEHIEDFLRNPTDSYSVEEQIDGCLEQAEKWRTIIRSWHRMIKEMLDQSLPAAARLTAGLITTPQTDSALDKIIPDYKRVMQSLEGLELWVDRLINRCTGQMQLTAARESLAESHNLARLTWLATIFVPLTFLTGFFSMNENVGSLKDTFGTYVAAAVPLAIFALIIAIWGARILRFILSRVNATAIWYHRKYSWTEPQQSPIPFIARLPVEPSFATWADMRLGRTSGGGFAIKNGMNLG